MLFEITHICFNEFDYVRLHCIMNIMAENGAKMTHKNLHYWFQANTIWHLSNKGYYKHTMTDVVVWLSCYLYIFAI